MINIKEIIKENVNILQESIQSQKDLELICDMLISLFKNNSREQYNVGLSFFNANKTDSNQPYDKDNFFEFLPTLYLNYNDVKYSKKLSRSFLNIFKSFGKPIKVSFVPLNNDMNLGIYYGRNINLIKLNCNAKILGNYPEIYVKNFNHIIVNNFIQMFRETIIHELQHWYDDIRSKGKYFDKNDNNNIQQYLNLSHEISARFTENVSKLDDVNEYDNFKDYFEHFINMFDGWKNLDEKIKKRLTVRLFTHYKEMDKLQK